MLTTCAPTANGSVRGVVGVAAYVADACVYYPLVCKGFAEYVLDAPETSSGYCGFLRARGDAHWLGVGGRHGKWSDQSLYKGHVRMSSKVDEVVSEGIWK